MSVLTTTRSTKMSYLSVIVAYTANLCFQQFISKSTTNKINSFSSLKAVQSSHQVCSPLRVPSIHQPKQFLCGSFVLNVQFRNYVVYINLLRSVNTMCCRLQELEGKQLLLFRTKTHISI